MYILLIVFLVILILTYFITHQVQFGKLPSGERLSRIAASANYRKGEFQNQRVTPSLAEGENFAGVMIRFLFSKVPDRKPAKEIPAVKTDLHRLPVNRDVLVWFGHSSYYLQVDGKRILVDPVLSGNAAPFKFSVKAFPGADIYKETDIPHIDFLFLTHDHWDHVDYETLIALKSRINKIICSLGTAAHLEHWGFAKEKIRELDWNEELIPEPGFTVHALPARHFSGRGFKRNQSIWLSFALKTPSYNLYLGGDSGYDSHFAEIGNRLGPFDLAILENGQYNKSWKYIHMMPEEVLVAGKDLKAGRILPVHNSKFALARHSWYEPHQRITQANEHARQNLVTPKIGEVVDLKNTRQVFTKWWEEGQF